MISRYADTGISGRRILDSLSANLVQDSYQEITRSAGLVSSVVWWTTPAKTQKIREITVTRSGNLVSSIETKQYNESGTLVATYTESITRSGGLVTSIAGSYT